MIPVLSFFEILSYFYKDHYGWDTTITDGTSLFGVFFQAEIKFKSIFLPWE